MNGWLIFYLIGSVFLFAVYAMGLSGWFFEYPLGLMAAIFIVLAAPLILMLTGYSGWQYWNISTLWMGAVLITARCASLVIPLSGDTLPPEDIAGVIPTLATIVLVSLAWATAWTVYLLRTMEPV